MDKRKRKISVPALLALALPMLLIRTFFTPGGGGIGAYSHYAGPVLPMTAISGGENLEVKRNVDFDFSAYESERKNILDHGSTIITDTYQLTNTSPETVTVELAYGFEGQFIDPAEQFPRITVDGSGADTVLLPSVDVTGTVHHASGWERYKKALTENDFLSNALTPAVEPEIPVTVYHFSNPVYEKPEVDTTILYGVQFTIPEGSRIWVRDYGMTDYDPETKEIKLYFLENMGDGWMFVEGENPKQLTFIGNAGYNETKDSALKELSVQMESYEADFVDCLWEFANTYDFWADNHGYPNPGYLTPELLYDGALKLMAEPNYRNPSGEIQAMSAMFYHVVTDIRLLYQVFPVEIPAGETVTVSAVFTQEPSTDNGGPKKPRAGYDMATCLGSNLNFTEQTSTLTNWEEIEIVKQNFGFDLKKEITEVMLDLAVERYFLDVAAK